MLRLAYKPHTFNFMSYEKSEKIKALFIEKARFAGVYAKQTGAKMLLF
jgi:hypothetical protein